MKKLKVYIKKPNEEGFVERIGSKYKDFAKYIGENAFINSFILNDIAVYVGVDEFGNPYLGKFNCEICGVPLYGPLIFVGSNLFGCTKSLTESQIIRIKKLFTQEAI